MSGHAINQASRRRVPVILSQVALAVGACGGEGYWGLPAEHPDVRAWKASSLRQVETHDLVIDRGKIRKRKKAA